MCWFCWVRFGFVDEENCVGFIKLRLYISQQGKHTFFVASGGVLRSYFPCVSCFHIAGTMFFPVEV